METTCRKCGKPYLAQRKTKLYCSANCRSAYGQRVKRGKAIANPLTETEAYLLEIVLEIAALTVSIWTEMKLGAGQVSLTNIERLGRCGGVAELQLVQELRMRYEEQKRLAARKEQLADKRLWDRLLE